MNYKEPNNIRVADSKVIEKKMYTPDKEQL